VTFVADAGAAVPYLVAAFAAAALLALVLTPVVRRVADRRGVVDRPDARRVNTIPVPRGGGVAIAAAFVVVSLAVVALVAVLGAPFDFVGHPRAELVALIGGGALAAALGVLDDRFDLRARWQLAGQVLLALVAVALGIQVGFIANPFGPGTIRLDGLFAAGFTIFWVVGMINSVNFVDGHDGLSGGIDFIAALTLGALSLTAQVDQVTVAVFCVILAGAVLGFLRWNIHPASVFAGTAGTMFLGYTLAVLAILGTAKVAVALLVLGVPIIDTFWTVVRRISSGRSPFTPDRGHLHHRLLDLGLSHRQTVLAIYAICTGLAAISLLTSGIDQVYAFLGVLVGIGLVLFALTRGGIAREALEAETYGDDPPDERADPLEVTADRSGSPAGPRPRAGQTGASIGHDPSR
jgi:UDP-GlcNAc:undecaprenyl-phosphate GlcNAc-1-phosphate transferase